MMWLSILEATGLDNFDITSSFSFGRYLRFCVMSSFNWKDGSNPSSWSANPLLAQVRGSVDRLGGCKWCCDQQAKGKNLRNGDGVHDEYIKYKDWPAVKKNEYS